MMTAWKSVERIADATLYLGDCNEIMPLLGRFDALVTDPPYGIKMDKGFAGFGGFGGFGAPIHRKKYSLDWDISPPNKSCFDTMLSIADCSIIFGGNYFSNLLPSSTHWIVWDKMNTMPTFSDCELIWTNLKKKSVKKITVEYNGLIGKEKYRCHPTQKPIILMERVINALPKECSSTIDPFMGSGTTGVACVNLGLSFTGIEMHEKYFDIACERIRQAYAQPRLFEEVDQKPVQVEIMGKH